ncbi:MAG: uroporphyrinogen decarboxylase family protein [Spirochaetales bacterium]|nr:uroporphyrinogen decarboxylase family protein [Spirochaetales bacterium]
MTLIQLIQSGADPHLVKEGFQKLWMESAGDLSSHERVKRALDHIQTDRVPFDFWVVSENWTRLLDYFHLKCKDELLDLLGIDCRIISPEYIGPVPETLEDGSFYSVLGSIRKAVRNEYSEYEEYAAFPLADAGSVAGVETWNKWPQSSWWNWDSLNQAAERANRQDKRHIRYDIGGIFESAWGLYGLDNFLMALYEKPEIPMAIMDCYTELFIANFKSAMSAAGDVIDMVYTYDDVAVQDGLLMSPEMWRKYILPFHQRLNRVIKEYDIKLIYHSCGSVIPLIDAFRDEMHIDVLNPLQPAARGMDMGMIKNRWGDSIAFHGGGDLQKTLPFGSVDDVRGEVDYLCRTLGAGGGYICTSAHYIQADVPLENILAFYSTDRLV